MRGSLSPSTRLHLRRPILAGSAGDAARVVFRLADGSGIKTMPQNGFYLTFMPYRAHAHGYAVIALDRTGRVLATRRPVRVVPCSGSLRCGVGGVAGCPISAPAAPALQ